MEHVFEAVKTGQMLQLCTSRGCSTALVRLIPKQAGEFGIVGEAGGLLQLAGREGQFVNFNGKEGSPSTIFAACIHGLKSQKKQTSSELKRSWNAAETQLKRG